MNYRHAFHAGNFADVLKHVLLTRILVHLRRKETPFRVVDTHAGIGRYDLGGDEAARTGEWRDGVGRLEAPFPDEVEALLEPYRAALAASRERDGLLAYPGSPAIVRGLLRDGDRAVFVEKHPDDARLLADRFRHVSRVKTLTLDGWTALRSLIPPRERRGLVLVDPPYEEPGELAAASERLVEAVARWPTGIFALWYPVKNVAESDGSLARLASGAGREVLRLELLVDRPSPAGRLAGSGLAVINPPWTLAGEAAVLLPALAERLARSHEGGFRCDVVAAPDPAARR